LIVNLPTVCVGAVALAAVGASAANPPPASQITMIATAGHTRAIACLLCLQIIR
jgi:hypothetical protein